jgi:hypothetical protein
VTVTKIGLWKVSHAFLDFFSDTQQRDKFAHLITTSSGNCSRFGARTVVIKRYSVTYWLAEYDFIFTRQRSARTLVLVALIKRCPQGLKRLRKNSVSGEILALSG